MSDRHRKRLDQIFRLRPITSLTLDRWAEANRVLPQSSAAVPGAWVTSRVEVASGPMRGVTEPGVNTITLKTATQMLKSELLLNTLAFIICERPGPVLFLQPKDDLARSFSRERIAPMIRLMPALRERISTNTTLQYLEFPAGFIAIEGAGSPTNLAARPIRYTLLDEIDKYEATKEGDAVLLAEERTATFADTALHIRCCSPTWEDTSRIERSYADSDQRRPYIACPHCADEFVFDFFKQVEWNKSEDGKTHFPLTAAIFCPECGAEITEDQRRKIISTEGAIRWRQTRPFICCGEELQDPAQTKLWDWDEDAQCGYALCKHCKQRAVSNTHAGFHVSKMYASHLTVVSLAEQWLAAKDDTSLRQVFYNTALGMAYAAQTGAKRVETHDLAGRREQFAPILDEKILHLFCGIDTQDKRVEAHVLGVGSGDELWSVHYQIFEGDPSREDFWTNVDTFLASTWPHVAGPMPIWATCIDSGGHHTEAVYNFAKPRFGRRIFAIKGSSWAKRGDPIYAARAKTMRGSGGYKPLIISVDSAKDALHSILMNDVPGPGYLHIPKERDDVWLDQLTAERLILETKGGQTLRKWILPRGRANEVWDTTVYAYSALAIMRARGLSLERSAANLRAYLEAKQKGTGHEEVSA